MDCFAKTVLHGQSGYKFANHTVNGKVATGIFPSTGWLKSTEIEVETRFTGVVIVRARSPKALSFSVACHWLPIAPGKAGAVSSPSTNIAPILAGRESCWRRKNSKC